MSLLADIEIPRSIGYPVDGEGEVQLHVFCDASIKAYAAVAFLRVRTETRVSVQLVQARSRITPLTRPTMPRLELLACTIAARLGSSIKTAYEEDFTSYYWTDSTIALAWIQRENVWGTYVGNRIKEINCITKKQDWRHVPGEKNPADLPSRGCTALQLSESRWWEGPFWLREPPECWPVSGGVVDEEQIQTERRKSIALNLINTVCNNAWFIPASSYMRNLRIMAYILRIVKTPRIEKSHSIEISAEELERAEKTLILLTQKESFQDTDDKIAGLKTVRDSDDLIRVETKLTWSDEEKDFRYPILLPHAHPLTIQLIRFEHFNNRHAGVQFLMVKIREKYWIIQGRKAIRRVLHHCVVCRRYTSRKPTAPVAPLPRDRVLSTAPFDVTGIDLAGPLYLKSGDKAWIVVFTCAVYRCLHLELTDSLSTDAFLLAFYRFVGRRRRPSVV